MKEQENSEPKPLDHEYDGIRELDNPLPNWWLTTFYGAIIFSFLYVGYYHFGPGPSLEDELSAGLAEIKAKEEIGRKKETAPTEGHLQAAFADNLIRAEGKKTFAEKCASCHGAFGEGQIGPNLTDNFWLHGNQSLSSILKIVSDGVPEKGMPPWKAMLKRNELIAVTTHVRGLLGSKPAHPKAPQGTEQKD